MPPRVPAIPVVLICLLRLPAAAQSEAERLIEAGHWKRARTIVASRLREAPGDPFSLFLLSQIHNAFGDRKTPLPLAERAVELDGKTAKYHRQLAEVLGVAAQHSGIFQQLLLARRFRREIDLALALDARDVQAWRDLLEYDLLAPGVVGGDPRKAAPIAVRISAIDPVQGLLARARIAEFHKQPEEAEDLARQAVAKAPANYRARMALAEMYLARSVPDLAGAGVQAGEARSIDPGRADAWGVLAEVAAARRDWSALEALLGNAAREAPDDLSPYFRAAARLLSAGHDGERAERYLNVYLSQPPEGNRPDFDDARQKLALAVKLHTGKADAAAPPPGSPSAARSR